MTELYLIAHRCRGEATFDVAERMPCPKCAGYPFGGYPEDLDGPGCIECDNEGFWWILSTCGYRAYPFWYDLLNDIFNDSAAPKSEEGIKGVMQDILFDCPTTALDCFPINSPSHKSLPDRSNDLLAKLGLTPKLPPLRRL